MTIIRSRHYNQNSLNIPSGSQQIPQFIPDELDSHMFQYNDQTSGNLQTSGTSKENNPSDDLEKVDFDVFGYEPAGLKRVRIDEGDDSEEEYQKMKRAVEANERERHERQSRRQKKEKEREAFDATPDTTQRNLNSENVPKTFSPLEGLSKSKSETKLRNIIVREGKGPLDYKKTLENTMITMSMMDFYRASPDFSRTSGKLSTRVNEKRVKRKNIAKPVWNLEPVEEELLAEASSSLVEVDCDRKIIPKNYGEKPKIDCLKTNTYKIPTVNLKTTPIIRTTARKDRAFRIPGEVLATRDGKTGKFFLDESMVCADQGSDMVLISPQLVRVLQLQKNSLNEINNQGIIMGTADGTSHRIIEWVSFVFVTRGIQRQICAFVRPERGPTLDLFLLLGLHREICTVLQGPTFKFAQNHRLLLQPTQIPFKGALSTEEFKLKEKALENKMKDIAARRDSEAANRVLSNYSGRKESARKFHDEQLNKQPDDRLFSSDTEDLITVDVSDYGEDHVNQALKSASTDPDSSDECEYSSDENSEDISENHMGKDRVTRM
ncbi:hypothetical protein EPUL_005908, partial [Erysiphe pulchra]